MRLHPRPGVATVPVALVAWLVVAPGPASAQTVSTTLGELETRVKAGTTVVVETVDGRRLKGRLSQVSESGLILDKVDAPAVQAEAIRTVSRREGRRPVLKGLLVGLGAGACLGLLALGLTPDQQPCAPGATCYPGFHVSAHDAAAVAVLGASIGAGAGALIPPPMRVVYRAPSPSRVSIAPFLTPSRRGIALSVVF
jgi:small nuclear ribonucleoprotein (snRNP)-like protein